MIDHQSQMSFATKSIDRCPAAQQLRLVAKAARESKSPRFSQLLPKELLGTDL